MERSSAHSEDLPNAKIRHEINNVLASIIGHTQLLKMRGELNEKSLERVGKIEELAQRIEKIAAQIK